MKKLAYILIFPLLVSSLPVYSQKNGKGITVKTVSQLPAKDKRCALIIGVDDY